MTDKARRSGRRGSRRRLTLRGLLAKLWWTEVLVPIGLAALMIATLIQVTYTGQRQMQLASFGETALRRIALRHVAVTTVNEPGAVLVVSATSTDLSALGTSPAGPSLDVPVIAYAQAIERLAAAGVPQIVLSLRAGAHLNTDEYFAPLVEALRRVAGKTQVLVAHPHPEISKLPPSLREGREILDDVLCQDTEVVQDSCPYNPDWKEWIVPVLVSGFLTRSDVHVPEGWTSVYLGASNPAFLLNLNHATDLRTHSLGDLLAGRVSDDQLQARIAFVGSDVAPPVGFEPTYPLRAITPRDVALDGRKGVPLHVFWAQIAQMFFDGATVTMPSFSANVGITVAVSVAIWLVLWRLGAEVALGLFLLFAVLGPFVNALAMRVAGVYFFLFDCYVFGLVTFLCAGFGRLSLSVFQRWRTEERRKIHSRTADLKGNFISLLSHNLNTPIAKMQGMLGILSGLPLAGERRAAIVQAERLVARLEICVRTVLNGSALEEGSIENVARTPAVLREEFDRLMGSVLKRLGIDLRVAVQERDTDVPLRFDPRLLCNAIGAASALFAETLRDDPEKTQVVRISFRQDDADEGTELVCAVESMNGWIPAPAQKVLDAAEPTPLRRASRQAFLPTVLATFIVQVVSLYGGRLVVSGTPEKGGRIEFGLRPVA
jgi:signal transduction histidine kinase